MILGLPAAEVLRHTREGVVEELGPDRCRLVLGSWSWLGLAAAIGRFDTDFEVVGPPELASAFRQLATRYAAATEPDTPGSPAPGARPPGDQPPPGVISPRGTGHPRKPAPPPGDQPANSPSSAHVRRRAASPATSVPAKTTSVAPASR